MNQLDLSQFKPAIVNRRFEHSSFALKASLSFSATLGTGILVESEIAISGGAFSKMLPFQKFLAKTEISADQRVYSDERGDMARTSNWSEPDVVSIVETPWVLEHVLKIGQIGEE